MRRNVTEEKTKAARSWNEKGRAKGETADKGKK